MNTNEPLKAARAKALLPDHATVLHQLALDTSPDGERCIPFAPIVEATKLPRSRVRFICRALARNGLAEFFSGLWSDDGEPRGSGYCITRKGYQFLPTSDAQRSGS